MTAATLLLLVAPLSADVSASDPAAPRVYWSGDRVAVVSARLVEYYKAPAEAVAFVGESTATAKPLDKAVLPRGKVFFKKGKSFLAVAPESSRPFASDLVPPGHPTGRRGAFILCAGGGAHYCGAVTVRGKEIFRLNSRPATGELQPAGLSEDGAEALFASVKTEPRREVTGWLIRTKKGSQRWVGLGDADAERLLKRFQGVSVLPEP